MDKKSVDLTIVIVSYNNEKQILKCLDSIVAETKSTLTQLIMVDNASSDGTMILLRESTTSITGTTSITSKNIRIKIIDNKENLGYSKAVNQGFREANSEVILLLNADTILTPGSLNELLRFEKNNRPCVIGPCLLNPDGTVQPSVFHLPTVVGAIKEFWLGRKGAYSKYTPAGNLPVKVEAVLGGAMLFSREVIEKVGRFDERYFMYFEDLDYCQRVGKAGISIYYLSTAKITHEHGASGKTLVDTDNQWRRMIPSSKMYFGLLKHYIINGILWIGQKTIKY